VKRLWLLRHAKAVPAETAPADFTRQLAERGERDARRIGERLASGSHPPARILASPAARARRTAEIVTEVLGQPSGGLVFDERLYLAAAGTLAAAVMATTNDLESLLIVGHNPGLSELAIDLAPELPLDDLPTSGIVGIDIETASWSELRTAGRHLRCFDFPKNAGPPIILR
jgi:phosphohistidine phosphatase